MTVGEETKTRPEGALDLPDGEWVLLRDASTVRQKDRKKLLRRMDDDALDPKVGDNIAGMNMVDTVIHLTIEDWSFALPLPTPTSDTLDELSIPQYDALTNLAQPTVKALFPDTDDPGDPTKREGPTGPSNG